jgi:hypothetical protein
MSFEFTEYLISAQKTWFSSNEISLESIQIKSSYLLFLSNSWAEVVAIYFVIMGFLYNNYKKNNILKVWVVFGTLTIPFIFTYYSFSTLIPSLSEAILFYRIPLMLIPFLVIPMGVGVMAVSKIVMSQNKKIRYILSLIFILIILLYALNNFTAASMDVDSNNNLLSVSNVQNEGRYFTQSELVSMDYTKSILGTNYSSDIDASIYAGADRTFTINNLGSNDSTILFRYGKFYNSYILISGTTNSFVYTGGAIKYGETFGYVSLFDTNYNYGAIYNQGNTKLILQYY